MRNHRLYVPETVPAGGKLRLDAERSHYVSRVLRARPGDPLVLFDGRGGEHAASIAGMSKQGVIVHIGVHHEGSPESPLGIHLLQGISRGDRMDWVVQKATELGVTRLTPVLTEFSVVHLDEDRAERRLVHWQKVAQGACEQCGRNRLPHIDAPRRIQRALDDVAPGAARIMLHPAGPDSLSAFAGPANDIALIIGPEGGLSESEIEAAHAAGFTRRALGPRILRTETAAVAAVTVLQSRLGDIC